MNAFRRRRRGRKSSTRRACWRSSRRRRTSPASRWRSRSRRRPRPRPPRRRRPPPRRSRSRPDPRARSPRSPRLPCAAGRTVSALPCSRPRDRRMHLAMHELSDFSNRTSSTAQPSNCANAVPRAPCLTIRTIPNPAARMRQPTRGAHAAQLFQTLNNLNMNPQPWCTQASAHRSRTSRAAPPAATCGW